MSGIRRAFLLVGMLCAHTGVLLAGYTNFESSHVHPLTLTPSGDRLLAVNTPDGMLEVFAVLPDGTLVPEAAVWVGLEPVTVVARSDTEAWVVGNLSDTVSIVDLTVGMVTQTLFVGDEPTDVVFAQGRAFVSVSQEDAVKVYDLANLSAAPTVVPLFTRDTRALAVAPDGTKVYAVGLRSGNRTTVLYAGVIADNGSTMDPALLSALNLSDITCSTTPPLYPPLPTGISRNPALPDPPPDPPFGNAPVVGLIVKWNDALSRWEDDAGQNWNDCIPYRLPDHDLFIIDASPPHAVTEVDHLGTSLFEVSVNPANGKIYVPHTEARNHVRFEHPLGVQGHVVDNRIAVVDPATGHSVTLVDLNTHINRASDPATNLSERLASISQPGMLVWSADGSVGYLAAIGSRKVFRVDGTCLSGSCIFGATRATPDTVEVGEGPTGVALHEASGRLYVLNRISHSIAVVDTALMTKIDEVALHDPSADVVRDGRRFLYDGIDTSGHGDAACASCHISGDQDGLAWDLGNPEGDFTLYSEPLDNVRFIGRDAQPCNPGETSCTKLTGFDPQKGPMTTQTLRAMLEPLHWRGDRATLNDFNQAFVGLMGTEDIGPINGKPAGLSASDMALFRQFALQITHPPNPNRNVDNTMPCGLRSVDPLCEVQPHGAILSGNPTEGELVFNNVDATFAGECNACHSHPSGTSGGKLGGVTPTEPTSLDAASLFTGAEENSLHSDLKVPHLRNMYDKFGPVWPDPGSSTTTQTKVGFGHTHDGAVPDMFRQFTLGIFSFVHPDPPQAIRDVVTFLFHFPTGTRPATGRAVTLPPGTPPTGPPADEALLTTLISLGDLDDANRHCELVATALTGGRRRSYRLSTGNWSTDVATESPITTTALRESAESPVTFTCAPIGDGTRLGGDRDEDGTLNGDDCTLGESGAGPPFEPPTIFVAGSAPTVLSWDAQIPITGPVIRYDIVGGSVVDLRSLGLAAATACIDGDLLDAEYQDTRPDPPPADGYYYLVRAENACNVSSFGAGRSVIDSLTCP